jgi:hypothetical protein
VTERYPRDELVGRLNDAYERQARLLDLRAMIERRAAHGYVHDVVFLNETRPIVDWLEREIAVVEQLLEAPHG